MPTRPTLVLFDLDGTLVDESGLPDAFRATCATLAEARPATTTEALIAANTETWQLTWQDVEEDWMLGGVEGSEVVEEVWRATLERCGVLDAASLALALTTWETDAGAAHRLYAEVPELLDALDAAGVRIGMVTNGASSVQRGKLRAVGLEGRLDPLVISSEVGVAKPHEGPFEHAIGVAHADPDTTWFVGDNLWTDVLGASRAGLRTVWIDRTSRAVPEGAPEPDLRLGSLAELVPALGL